MVCQGKVEHQFWFRNRLMAISEFQEQVVYYREAEAMQVT